MAVVAVEEAVGAARRVVAVAWARVRTETVAAMAAMAVAMAVGRAQRRWAGEAAGVAVG